MTDYTPPQLSVHEIAKIAAQEQKLAEERARKRIADETAKRDTQAIEAKKAEIDAKNEELGSQLLRFQRNPSKYRTECEALIKQIEANEHEKSILDL